MTISQPPPAEHAPGFSIIHSNRMEALRELTARWICQHPLHPLENEIIIVQSNGMAQWLQLALAANTGCGISAAVEIHLPARFLWQLYRFVLGTEAVPPDSPFDKDRLVWRILRLLPALLEDPRFTALDAYLRDDADLRKRYQLARHLADLFDQYQVYRADWLESWAKGSDLVNNAMAEPEPLPTTQSWQPVLWRRLLADVSPAGRQTSRSGLHRRFLKAVSALEDRPPDLPRRIIVFGISAMPRQALEAFSALSHLSQVLLLAHNPCPHYWADIIEDRELFKIERARHRPKKGLPPNLDFDALHQHVNPLLAAWGRQGRDYIGLLYGYDQPENYRQRFAAIDLFEPVVPAGRNGTLLESVQQAIFDLTPLPGPGQPKGRVFPTDKSLCFHLAHSRQREVEILQDQLLDSFESQPDLRPRDIMVMAPDISLYAPHIEAVFGRIDPDDPRHIPYSIADRREPAGAAIHHVFETLLQLPELRLTASELARLLESAALCRRFGLHPEDRPQLQQWITAAGICWGLDAEHRTRFGLPADLHQNTWAFGLARILLGYATGDGPLWQSIAPYAEIGGLQAGLAGALARMVGQLRAYEKKLHARHLPEAWGTLLYALLNDFFLPTDNDDLDGFNRLSAAIGQWVQLCTESALEEALPLSVVRESLLSAFQQRHISQRFLVGRVNFGTLMPMRAVPFQIIYILGLNDDEYPRTAAHFDFDLMRRPGHYRPGDRSRREDDRYLFLEALLSARKAFHISYIGRSEKDNAVCMPSVLVGQLQDYLATGWELAGSARALLDHLTTVYPLQPFSPAYFNDTAAPALFTYAHEWQPAPARPPATPVKAPPPDAADLPDLNLHHLTAFLKNPMAAFFKQRLATYFEPIEDSRQDDEPFSLSALAPFQIVPDLLAQALAARSDCRRQILTTGLEKRQAEGRLPLKAFGEIEAKKLRYQAEELLAVAEGLEDKWPLAADDLRVDLRFGDRRLIDNVSGLRQNAAAPDKLARWQFSYRSGKPEKKEWQSGFAALWLHHLAACAQGKTLESCLPGRAQTYRLPPLPADQAGGYLADIVHYWRQNLEKPLPVTARTAWVWLEKMAERKNGKEAAPAAARRVYEGDGFRTKGELDSGDGSYLRRCYPNFETLYQSQNGLFVTLAEVIYKPLRLCLEPV